MGIKVPTTFATFLFSTLCLSFTATAQTPQDCEHCMNYYSEMGDTSQEVCSACQPYCTKQELQSYGCN
jgi:hypothetical protein